MHYCCFERLLIVISKPILRQHQVLLHTADLTIKSVRYDLQVLFIPQKICITCVDEQCAYVMLFYIACIRFLYVK